MTFGKGWSADTVSGWHNHYKRMNRWKIRSLETLNDLPRTNFQDAFDFTLAYFLWSHSFVEWLCEGGIITKKELFNELKNYEVWPLCRDVANRTRHFELKNKPTDKYWTAYRENDFFAYAVEGKERHIVNIMFDGKKWRATDAIQESDKMWKQVLEKQNANI